MKQFILEACHNKDLVLFSELQATFPSELLQASVAELGELYEQLYSALAAEYSKPKVGARVVWQDCPASLAVFNPFTVRRVERDLAYVDWIYHPISCSRLILAV